MNQSLRSKIKRIIYNDLHLDDWELISQLKQLLHEADQIQSTDFKTDDFKDLASISIEQLLDKEPSELMMSSGYAGLDRIIGGFGYGEYVILGGRPGMGKTQFLVNLCLNIAQNDAVLFVTYNLSKPYLTHHLIARMAAMEMKQLYEPHLQGDEVENLKRIIPETENYNIFITDECRNSVTALRALCRKQVEEKNIRFVIIDFIQLMGANRYHTRREMEISFISRELKNMAQELNICVLAVSQLNRMVEHRALTYFPRLSDLRDSGALEQDADKVVMVYRPEYYGLTEDDLGYDTKGLIELLVVKNRHGGLGTARLLADSKFIKIVDYEVGKQDFQISQERLDDFKF